MLVEYVVLAPAPVAFAALCSWWSTSRQLLQFRPARCPSGALDASVRELVCEVVTDVRDTNDEVASVFFKGNMREELMSVMVEVIGHEKFGASVSFMAFRCMADDFLTHTISEGVQEALEDVSQREPIKSLMIVAMMDAKLQGRLPVCRGGWCHAPAWGTFHELLQ